MGIINRIATEEYTQTYTNEIVTTIRNDIQNIKNFDVPEYWMSHLDEKIDLIWKAMESAGRNKSAFFFYSDAHWWAKDRNDEGVTWQHSYTTKTEPMLLKYLYQNTPINKTNFGGDFIGEEADITTDNGRKIMSYIYEWRKAIRDLPNHHSVVGNHDDGNEIDGRFTDNFIYSYLFAPEETNDITQGEGFYYYIDNNCEKTRYLYLDTAYKGVTDAQIEFVKEALLSTPSGWHIVAITHKWYETNYNTNPVSTGDMSTDGATLLAMFDAYNARTEYYAECEGWVEFCIGSHTHCDYDGTSEGGIPIILTESSSLNDRSGLNPVPGTITETAISAIIADYNNAKIEIIRIGRGSDREVLLIDHRVVSYTNRLPLAIDTSGAVFDGIGYRTDARISGSSGTSSQTGCCATGYIPCKKGDIIRLENITMSNINNTGQCCVAVYNTLANTIAKTSNLSAIVSSSEWKPVYDGNNLVQFTIPNYTEINDGDIYFRICADVINGTSIITVNETIE